MENTQDTESKFIKDVQALEAKEKEKIRQIREGFSRLGLPMPKQVDNSRTLSVAERFGLK